MEKINFDVEVSVKGDQLFVKTEAFADPKILYAFYLMRNGSRIDTRWYTSENTAVFKILANGEYKVTCFMKDENGGGVHRI